jgi:hypothetical protein
MEDQFDAKALKKLADACRKSGIKQFKGYGVEFTLSDDLPQPKRRQKQSKGFNVLTGVDDSSILNEGGPSEEELLMWSAVTAQESSSEDGKAN